MKNLNYLSKNINLPYQFSKKKVNLSFNNKFQKMGMTQPPLAMPDDSMCDNVIQSYRKYYILHKKNFVKWTNRSIPWWFYFM